MTALDRDSKGRFISDEDAAQRQSTAAKIGLVASAATAGAALGVMALFGRKTAVQAPTIMAGDWPGGLAAEHHAILRIFDDMQATQTRSTARRTMLLAHLKHALAKHALEEENVIYPALRESGERAVADRLVSAHGYVKQRLYELENMPRDAPEFLEKIGEFRRELEDHMHEEKERFFPALFASLDAEKNRTLTRAMNREGFKLA